MLLLWISGLGSGMVLLHFVQKLLFPYFWEDFWYLLKVVCCGIRLQLYNRKGQLVTVLDKFLSQAKKQPQKPFIIYEGDIYTYEDVDKRSSKVAYVFLNHSTLKRGDTVALLMSNEPDFVHVWFGLAKLGCVVAFLNSNIRSNSLLHCIRSCEPRALVVGTDLLEAIEEILPSLPEDISVWGMRDSVPQGIISLTEKLTTASDTPVPLSHCVASNLKSPYLYIFTSGTTGLPKAAVITQLQALKGSAGFWAFGCTTDDIIYITLPLYHSAGSLLGIGGCIELGATCVLKKKFSASQFWNDCKKYNVTVFQYIGEICRYLCKQPKREGEKDHQVRLAIGNGVRSDVWREFVDRFGNIKMCELYGATEGNICFMNHTGKIGAVGRTNFFYKFFFNFDLIKYDFQKDEPIRNEQGWCSRVKKDCEGKAGMASIILKPNKSLDLEKVYKQVVTFLPAYACPWFLRIQEKMEVTGTFKPKKFQLVQEGFSPLKISDPLYFMDNLKKAYVPLTKELYDQIMLGEIRL
ncbi:long-chain fatty acid transport protein 6 isoform 2-T2 [Glossophaga mutica]